MRAPIYFFILAVALMVAGFLGAIAYFALIPPSRTLKNSPAEAGLPLSKSNPPARPVITSSDPVNGNPDAPITIVEFGDFLCPACAEISPTLKQILAEQKNNVRLVWKDAPNIRRHALAQRAAEAARCAREQDQFWQYHDRLFENQTNLNEEIFRTIANNLNLNLNSFNECLSSGRAGALIERNLNEALLLGVDATPYLFIDGQRFSGAISKTALDEALTNALQNL